MFKKIDPDYEKALYYYNEAQRVLRIILFMDDLGITEIENEPGPGIFLKGWEYLSLKVLNEAYGVPMEVNAGTTLYDEEGNGYVIQSDYVFREITPYDARGLVPQWLEEVARKFAYDPIVVSYRAKSERIPYPNPLDPSWEAELVPASFQNPAWRVPTSYTETWGIIYSETGTPTGGGNVLVKIRCPFISLLQTKQDDHVYMEHDITDAFVHVPGNFDVFESKGINDSYDDTWLWLYSQLNGFYPWTRIMRWAWLQGETDYFNHYKNAQFENYVECLGHRFFHHRKSTDRRTGGMPPVMPIPTIIESFGLTLSFMGEGGFFGIRLDNEHQ